MNAIIGKSFSQLRKSEQDRLMKVMEDWVDDELCKAQFIWIKYNCVAMANAGATADEILNYLGGWRHVYRINSRFKTKEEQDAFLDARMDEIFGAGGFPQDFMESLKDIGR